MPVLATTQSSASSTLKSTLLTVWTLAFFAALGPQLSTAQAQGTTFTYQGRLNIGGAPYTGNAGFIPTLWDAGVGGNSVAGNSPTGATVSVTNGLFVLALNFGGHFSRADRWLQLQVNTNGEPYITLAPRQPLTATPYAIHSASASNVLGTVTASQLTGQLSGAQIADGAVGAAKVNSTEVQLRVAGTAPVGQFITGIAPNGSISAASDTTD